MHKKKYGKLTVSAWLNLEMSQSSPFLMILLGLGLMIAAVAVRIHVGSPYPVILSLGVKELFPSVWIMSIIRMLSFFTVGCAAGFVLGYREPGIEGEKFCIACRPGAFMVSNLVWLCLGAFKRVRKHFDPLFVCLCNGQLLPCD